MSFWTFIQSFFQSEVQEDPMKYLVVGLGNIGAEYEDTRHNIGFKIVEYMAAQKDVSFKSDSKASVATIKHKGRTLVMIKPSTYMNLSGQAVRYWMQKEKIPKERIIVVLDDLNLTFGILRMRGKGADGGHNGLKNIDQLCGGNNYPRLRVGIGAEFSKGRQVDYVLGEWSDEEKKALPEVIKKSADAIMAFASIGLGRAMNQFNTKKGKKKKQDENPQ